MHVVLPHEADAPEEPAYRYGVLTDAAVIAHANKRQQVKAAYKSVGFNVSHSCIF